ncbi:MAG: DUF4349 domain-containing protein [Patescibacteria group bacterium]|jgi:hypothetical protein
MPPAATPAASAVKPKRRLWLWVLIVIGGLVALSVAGFIALLVIIANSDGLTSTNGVVTQNLMMKSGGAAGLAISSAPVFDTAESANESFSRGGMMPPVPVEPRAGQTAAEVDQKIIKNGSLQLVVDDVSAATAKITAAASGKGGFTQNSTITERADGTHSGYITIRVPAGDFETLMAEIKTFATAVKNESANGQDVTEQYSDLEAQLRNAQAQEKTYLAVLDKAKSVEEILKVQDYLGQIRGTIESLQGRLKYLSNVTSYSTINVSLEEEPRIQLPTKEFRPGTELKAAVQTLVASLQGIVVSMIWFVVVVGGSLLPIAILIWIIVLVVKKLRRKK